MFNENDNIAFGLVTPYITVVRLHDRLCDELRQKKKVHETEDVKCTIGLLTYSMYAGKGEKEVKSPFFLRI